MRLDEIVFGVPLLVGVLLVVCSAFGAAELSGDGFAGDDADGYESDGLLGVLGIGRVPLVIVCMLLLFLFGGTGLLMMSLANPLLGERLGFLVVMPVALMVALFGTAVGTRLLERVLPGTESYAPERGELVGLRGTALVQLGRGEFIARVVDRGGAELRVVCVAEGPDVRVGDRVLLIAFESFAGSGRYLIEATR